MSARARHGMLIGVAVILLTIAPVQTFAEFENAEWDVHELYKQCMGRKGSLDEIFCLEFVSGVARQVFAKGGQLKDIKDSPDLMTMSVPSACPKSFVSNDAMVEAFNAWANQHIEKWSASAQKGSNASHARHMAMFLMEPALPCVGHICVSPLYPESGHVRCNSARPLSARSGHRLIQLGFLFSASFSALRTISTPMFRAHLS